MNKNENFNSEISENFLLKMDVLSKMFIGSIHAFTGNPTANFLRCDGAAYQKTEFPLLYNVIGDSFKDHYNEKKVLPNGFFAVPDLTARFLSDSMGTGVDATHLTNGKLGDFHTDMMRQIKGYVENVGTWGAGNMQSGALYYDNLSKSVTLHNSGDSTRANINIDTAIDNAIPSGSKANVGFITRPATVNIYFYILAKV